MKSQIRTINDHGHVYEALAFICPGCESQTKGSGLHLLPVSGDVQNQPRWDWNGDTEKPTLNPSILTRMEHKQLVCHSFLRDGVFEFLSDSTHKYAGQNVDIPDLPDWAEKR